MALGVSQVCRQVADPALHDAQNAPGARARPITINERMKYLQQYQESVFAPGRPNAPRRLSLACSSAGPGCRAGHGQCSAQGPYIRVLSQNALSDFFDAIALAMAPQDMLAVVS